MEHDRTQRYVETLEKAVEKNYGYLHDVQDEFRDKCLLVASGGNVPQGIVAHLKVIYHEMRTRVSEITALQNLLQGKYRKYVRRDLLRDKKISELSAGIRSIFQRFDGALRNFQAKSKNKDLVRRPWFRVEENQVILIKNLRILDELTYEPAPHAIGSERRNAGSASAGSIGPPESRWLTLFVLNGDAVTLDTLQTRIRLREHDVVERHRLEEIRGVLTHLTGPADVDVEKLFRAILEREKCAGLKCLLVTIRSHKDLAKAAQKQVDLHMAGIQAGEIHAV
jgi:hypothetical protein